MKKILTCAASVFVTVGAFAQGTILFGNTSGSLKAPIYGVEAGDSTGKHGNTAAGIPAGSQTYGGALLAGTGFTCELWGHVGSSQPLASLTALQATPFRTGTAAGFINTLTTVVPNAPLDGNNYFGTFEVRAWDNQGGTITTWAQVMANPNIPRGASGAFSPVAPLGGTGTPAATPGGLAGLTSFNLFTPVPEPSLIALGALGLGALLLRRRKA